MKFAPKALLAPGPASVFMVAAIAIFPLLAEAGAVDQLHQFLNSTRTLKADFSQIVVGKGGRRQRRADVTLSQRLDHQPRRCLF